MIYKLIEYNLTHNLISLVSLISGLRTYVSIWVHVNMSSCMFVCVCVCGGGVACTRETDTPVIFGNC